jgi:hypothetical protein
MAQRRQRKPRDWPARIAAAMMVLAALLTAGVWVGIAQNAFVVIDSIHAVYFKQSYDAGPLPLALAALLLVVAIAVLWRGRIVVPLAVPVVILAGLNEIYSGRIGVLGPFIHPMQIVPRLALGLTLAAMLASSLLVLRRPARIARS